MLFSKMGTNTEQTNAELLLQLEALKHRIIALEAQAKQPAELRCTKLEVVNDAGDVVATICNNGTIVAHALAIEEPMGRNSLRFDAVFGELEILRANQPTVVLNQSGLGKIRLDCTSPAFNSFVEIAPQPEGGRLQLGDKNGKTVFDANTGSAGMVVDLRSHDPQKGEVQLVSASITAATVNS
jgi:hypothetical protein